MDIVSRLKEFISFSKIPVTQFADNCKIPRPTLSQLLNGRNKKVSDELISKIHLAYPNLSMLWLMFGEGVMLPNQNFQFSGPQNAQNDASNSQQNTINENITPEIDFQKSFSDSGSNNQLSLFSNSQQLNVADSKENDTTSTKQEAMLDSNPATITFGNAEHKRIVNIIVYYDDNSFQAFVPKEK